MESPVKQEKKLVNSKNEGVAKESRSIFEIQRVVNKLVQEDEHLRVLIPNEDIIDNASSNNLIKDLKEELLLKLYQHVEFVLLNQSDSYPLKKDVLEKRLAAATGPVNAKSF